MKVSFYPGCTAHSTGIEYSMSLRAVFDSLGVELVEIDDWNCCGGAAAHSLNHALGLALPARTIAQAQKRDLPVAVPCAGCFNALKKAQDALSKDGDLKRQLEDMVGFTYAGNLQVQAMVELLWKQIGLETVAKYVRKALKGLKVASYYGCALVRRPEITGMGDHENPVFLDDLVECLGGSPIDWSYKTDCCGADLALTHGEMVEKMADKLAAMALEAGADCLVCHCGLCQINVEMRQTGKNRKKIPVFYFTELMGIAFDLPDRDVWWGKHMVNPGPTLEPLGLLD